MRNDDDPTPQMTTIIAIMVGIIIGHCISCYYMQQGGFIMTCQQLLSSTSEARSDAENQKPEKVPLNHDESANDKANNV